MLLSEFSEHNRRVDELRARQTRDALLTMPTRAEAQSYFESRAKVDPGQVWDGIRAALDAIPDPASRKAVADAIREGIERYGLNGNSAWCNNGTGSAITDAARLGHLSGDAASNLTRVAAINRANRTFWNP